MPIEWLRVVRKSNPGEHCTFTVSLPQEWIRGNKLTGHSELVLRLDHDGNIVISPSKNETELQKRLERMKQEAGNA